MAYVEPERLLVYNPAFFARVMRKRAAEKAAAERAARMSRAEYERLLAEEARRARAEILATKALKVQQEVADAAARVPLTEFQRIVRRAIRVFKYLPEELNGKSRDRQLAFARQFICYWAARRTGLSKPMIGRLLGGRDHTTCLHGARVYPEKRKKMGRYLPPAR